MVNRELRIIFCGIIVLILLTPVILLAQWDFSDFPNQKPDISLLLSQGSSGHKLAQVKYFLWTQDDTNREKIKQILASSSMLWERQVLSDFSGEKAYKYLSQVQISKEDEKRALEVFLDLHRELSGLGVRAYFQELIESDLDPVLYCRQNNIQILQKLETDNFISAAGVCPGLFPTIEAGPDKINIQVLTKNGDSSKKGKTLIAIPALFEDF